MRIKIDEMTENQLKVVEKLQSREPFLWLNPNYDPCNDYVMDTDFSQEEIVAASARLKRFAPFLALSFKDAAKTQGIIESPLVEVQSLGKLLKDNIPNHLMLKLDSHLPISGSIKARGGIHEVLCHAENLLISAGLLKLEDNYECVCDPKIRDFLSQYTIQVGSTGNLGLSIGIMSAVLGFKVIVHMSSDAKAWKKEMLRTKGVEVIEYEEDYGVAVKKGRALSDMDPMSYFVDDEHSSLLFAGYAVAGERLRDQILQMKIQVDDKSPLFVYLPCGVGGGPGGVAYGIKNHFGANAHVFFAEPVESPCMLLSMATQSKDSYDVTEIGLSNKTLADGLAVGRASSLVSELMNKRLSGIATVLDETLLEWLKLVWEEEKIQLEPSALAGFAPLKALSEAYLETDNCQGISKAQFINGTHIVWATGGSMVPEADFKKWIE